MHPRYLILGGSGFLGRSLHSSLGAGGAIATYKRTPIAGGIHFDASEHSLAARILTAYPSLTHAFILMGITNLDACARDPAGTARINVDAIKEVIAQLRDAGITPVFASSDAVFDGSRGGWTEDDPPCPVLTYGRQKAAVEAVLLADARPSLIVRLPKILSTIPGARDMLDGWMSELESGAEIRCAHDQLLSPVDVDEAVQALVGLVNSQASGVFHFAAPQAVSRLALLDMLVHEVQHHRVIAPRITRCSIRDFAFAEARPLDGSMSAAKLESQTGFRFSQVQRICARAAARRYATLQAAATA